MIPTLLNPTTELTVALVAAAGALLVAYVAGGFSLLGLIISKEQQVSGFRQSWIDALRADIAALAAHAHQIQSFAVGRPSVSYEEFWKATHDDYVGLNQAAMRIRLRLNPEEDETKPILQAMGSMEVVFDRLRDPHSTAEIARIVDALERAAPTLLKKEWERVKSGERTYRIAKWLAMLIFGGTGIGVGLLLSKIYR